MQRPVVGIPRQGNDCHAVSLFQMIANSKALSKRLWMHCPEMKVLLNEYKNATTADTGITTIGINNNNNDMSTLGRRFCRFIFPHIPSNQSIQQDPHEGLQYLFTKLEDVNKDLCLIEYNQYDQYQPIDVDPIPVGVKVPKDVSVLDRSNLRKTYKNIDWWLPICDIAGKSQFSTDNLIRSLFVDEASHNDDACVFANQIGEKRKYTRQLTWKKLTTIPDALVIVPKRNTFSKHGGINKDNVSKLDLPMQIILDSEYFDSPHNLTPPVTYYLRSFLVHHGKSATSGHYVSYVKSYTDNNWYLINDSHVQPVDISSQDIVFGHILLYERVDVVQSWPLLNQSQRELSRSFLQSSSSLSTVQQQQQRSHQLEQQRQVQATPQYEVIPIQLQDKQQQQQQQQQPVTKTITDEIPSQYISEKTTTSKSVSSSKVLRKFNKVSYDTGVNQNDFNPIHVPAFPMHLLLEKKSDQLFKSPNVHKSSSVLAHEDNLSKPIQLYQATKSTKSTKKATSSEAKQIEISPNIVSKLDKDIKSGRTGKILNNTPKQVNKSESQSFILYGQEEEEEKEEEEQGFVQQVQVNRYLSKSKTQKTPNKSIPTSVIKSSTNQALRSRPSVESTLSISDSRQIATTKKNNVNKSVKKEQSTSDKTVNHKQVSREVINKFNGFNKQLEQFLHLLRQMKCGTQFCD